MKIGAAVLLSRVGRRCVGGLGEVDPYRVCRLRTRSRRLHQSLRRSAYSGLGAESVPPELDREVRAAAARPRRCRAASSRCSTSAAPAAASSREDGERMFFTWRVTGTAQVWRQDGPQKFPVQLTGGEDTHDRRGPRARRQLRRRQRAISAAQENPGLYLMQAEGGPLEVDPAQAEGADVARSSSPTTRRRSTSARTTSSRTSYAIYRYDSRRRSASWCSIRPGLWQRGRPPGRRLAAGEGARQHARRRSTSTTSREGADAAPRPGRARGVRRRVSARAGRGSGAHAQARRVPAPLPLEAGKLDADHARAASTTSRASRSTTRARGSSTRQRGRLRAARTCSTRRRSSRSRCRSCPRRTTSASAASSRDGRFVALAVDSGKLRRRRVTYDWKTRKLDAVARAERARDRHRRASRRATLEYYPARDGTKIPMFVRRPASVRREPVPGDRRVPRRPRGPGDAGLLARRAALRRCRLRVRRAERARQRRATARRGCTPTTARSGSTSSPTSRTPRSTSARRGRRTASRAEGRHLRRQLRRLLDADGDDVRSPARTTPASSIVGIINLVTFLENTAPYRRSCASREYGDPVKDKDALAKLSPITYVDEVKAPLLLIQGVTIRACRSARRCRSHDALEAKIAAGSDPFADEGHGAQKRGNIVLPSATRSRSSRSTSSLLMKGGARRAGTSCAGAVPRGCRHVIDVARPRRLVEAQVLAARAARGFSSVLAARMGAPTARVTTRSAGPHHLGDARQLALEL